MERVDGLGGTLTWKSSHGSLVAAAHDLATVDGLNEEGLAAHQLFLAESDYGQRDEGRVALSVAVWMQYVLDNFTTVAESVNWMVSSQLQIVTQSDPSSGKAVNLHLALEDRSGDSAIIEYLDGIPQVHHDHAYTVVTNSPPYEQQLAHLKTIQGLGGSTPLPGGTDASDRFARAAYYLTRLPQPTSTSEAVASLLSVMRNAAQPFRVPDPHKPYASQTIWRTVIDLTHGIYVYESTSRPNIIWVRMSELDLSEGAPAMKLDLADDTGLSGGFVGDVSARFTPSTPMHFLPAH
ncbi:putative Choloylglycine hydrolase [Streptomyces sp. Tu6071]|nr:putative Choloylglycine hydrolase [Streptomyces sp. Tu6071]